MLMFNRHTHTHTHTHICTHSRTHIVYLQALTIFNENPGHLASMSPKAEED